MTITKAYKLVAEVHDRMPVLLGESDYEPSGHSLHSTKRECPLFLKSDHKKPALFSGDTRAPLECAFHLDPSFAASCTVRQI
jgi:hypothetical protein